MEQLKSEVDKLKKECAVSLMSLDTKVKEVVSKQISDLKEKERRKANVMIYNIQESESDNNTQTIQDYYRSIVESFIKNNLKILFFT